MLITGAGTGIGRLAARTLADHGHAVFVTMRDPEGRNADKAADLRAYGRERSLDLHVVELDVLVESSARSAVDQVVSIAGRLDVLVHNAAHLMFGITEAFEPEQVLASSDTNAVRGAAGQPRRAPRHARTRQRGCFCGSAAAPASWSRRSSGPTRLRKQQWTPWPSP